MSEQKQMNKALAIHVAKVTQEMDRINKLEGDILQHYRVAGSGIEDAIIEAGYAATHKRMEAWYGEVFPNRSIRTLQNARQIAKEWERVVASGATSVRDALKAVGKAKAKKGSGKGDGDGEGDGDGPAKYRRTPRVSPERVDVETALDALALHIKDVAVASPDMRVKLLGKLLEVQRQINEFLRDQVGGREAA